MLHPAILDGHNDTLLRLYIQEPGNPRAFFEEHASGHLDLPRAKRGGLAGGFFALYTPAPAESEESDPFWELTFTETGYRQKLRSPIDPDYARVFTGRLIDYLDQIVESSRGELALITDYPQLKDCLKKGIFAMILHIEGAEAVRADLSNLEEYYRRGLRSLGIVWSRPNAFGWGVPFCFPQDPDTGPGLTPAGRALVRECNRLGILLDLSHLNAQGFWDAASISTAPLVVTHTGVYSICPSSRNLTDDQIAAIGASGGVIGINFETINLRPDGRPDGKTPLTQIVSHIDYVVEKIGAEYAAFGSDFDGADISVELKDASGLPELIQALRERGYQAGDIEKIARQNWMRVLKETWAPGTGPPLLDKL